MSSLLWSVSYRPDALPGDQRIGERAMKSRAARVWVPYEGKLTLLGEGSGTAATTDSGIGIRRAVDDPARRRTR
jgi:hypothetical protein